MVYRLNKSLPVSFNTRARTFYEGHGYRQVGEFPDYVIEGASEILMYKRLERA